MSNSSKILTKPFKIRLKKGDNVVVLSGKYKGQSGIIEALHPKQNKATVKGINVVKKAIKPDKQHPRGGLIELTKPIWISKLSVIDPSTKKPSRIGYKVDSKGLKIRVYKSSGKEIKEAK